MCRQVARQSVGPMRARGGLAERGQLYVVHGDLGLRKPAMLYSPPPPRPGAGSGQRGAITPPVSDRAQGETRPFHPLKDRRGSAVSAGMTKMSVPE